MHVCPISSILSLKIKKSRPKTVRLGAVGVRYRTLFKLLKNYLADNKVFVNKVSILA